VSPTSGRDGGTHWGVAELADRPRAAPLVRICVGLTCLAVLALALRLPERVRLVQIDARLADPNGDRPAAASDLADLARVSTLAEKRLSALLRSPSALQRREALCGVMLSRCLPPALRPLVEERVQDADPEVRLAAVYALHGALPTADALARFAALARSPSPDERVLGATGLSLMQEQPEAAGILRTLLYDRSPDVVGATASSLAWPPLVSECAPRLRHLLLHDSAQVRIATVKALAEHHLLTPEVAQAWEEAAGSADAGIRARARALEPLISREMEGQQSRRRSLPGDDAGAPPQRPAGDGRP